MGLETGNTIPQLNINWPLGSDPKSQGDDHLRLIKVVLENDVLSKSAGGTVAGDVTFTGLMTIEDLLTLTNGLDVTGGATVDTLTATELAELQGGLDVTGASVLDAVTASGVLTAFAGTVGAPGIVFAGSGTTGLFRGAADEYHLGVLGVDVLAASAAQIALKRRAVSTIKNLVSGTSIAVDLTAENTQFVNLDANATFTLTGTPVVGQWVTLCIKQGATGGTGAFVGVTRWQGGNIAPQLSVGAGSYDYVTFHVPEAGIVLGTVNKA